MEEEIFIEIKEYPNYFVSNFGRIKTSSKQSKHSIGRFHSLNERIMKCKASSFMYNVVSLRNKQGAKTFLVSRLVAKHFLENPENFEIINHIDGNKKNDHYKNLEWCTQLDNVKHAFLMGLNKSEKPIEQLTMNGVFIRDYKSSAEAGRLGFHFSNISQCCRGLRKSSGGFKWRYKNINKVVINAKTILDKSNDLKLETIQGLINVFDTGSINNEKVIIDRIRDLLNNNHFD
jgi:hypothetical protein